MKKEIFSYLKRHFSRNPFDIDRILISAFFEDNNLIVKKNAFLKSYIISSQNVSEYESLTKFLLEIKKRFIRLNIESLIEFFEFVISPEDRVINGAVYTPKNIREYIIKKTVTKYEGSLVKVADISCGCGGFLYNAAKEIKKLTNQSYYKIFKEQIFGLDIQQYSVTRTKLLLAVLAISEGEDETEFTFNIFRGNALSFSWEEKLHGFKGFHTIVGNPPYVCSRNIPAESKDLLKNWEVCKSGHPDLYIPFFQIALENLMPGGILGYITMSSFFRSVNGRAVRKYFQGKSYAFKIIDFGATQVFRSKSTYTCICLIEKKEACGIKYYKYRQNEIFPPSEKVFHEVEYSFLDAQDGWNLGIHNRIIARIENVGMPLSERFKTRNGIATLKNSIYIFKPEAENRMFYYIKCDGVLHPIEKAVCRPIVNPNLLTNEETLDGIIEQIIFPYEFIGNEIQVISESDFRIYYPNAYDYLRVHKTELATRDKGKGAGYKPWFAYGRNQSLERLQHKLFLPHITPKIPNYIINSDMDLLFYNGLAIIGESVDELLVLKKIISSRLFWFYVQNISRSYGSEYLSLSKNYIKNFGIPDFTDIETDYIINEQNVNRLNSFFEQRYDINLVQIESPA